MTRAGPPAGAAGGARAREGPGGPAARERGAELHSGYVALVGHTNVGKSTLLNRLVGEKIAIVANVPQTTRTRITGVLTLPGGQIVFVDTPGFHRPQHRMNRAMIDVATAALSGVDVLVWVVDATVGFGPGDTRVGRMLAERRAGRAAEGNASPGTAGGASDDRGRSASAASRAGRGADAPSLFLALNKIDLVPKPRLIPMLQQGVEMFGVDEAFPVSAKTGDNCDRLVSHLLQALPRGPMLYPEDTLTDQPERVLVSELIREKILERTLEEIPHATAVTIERWVDGEDGLTRIDAVILVEREGQKGIVIGKGGDMLKQVGTQARLEIERLLGRRVGLKLWVRVRSHWRDDEGTLHTLGLT